MKNPGFIYIAKNMNLEGENFAVLVFSLVSKLKILMKEISVLTNLHFQKLKQIAQNFLMLVTPILVLYSVCIQIRKVKLTFIWIKEQNPNLFLLLMMEK